MQYFLSHLSLSYEFVLWASRNKSKWCTITATATLHGLLEIVTTVTSFHRNNGMVEISSRWWVMIRVILMTSWQWSGWHWLVSFVSFMTSSSDDEWTIEMCDMWSDTRYNMKLTIPILADQYHWSSWRKIKLVLAQIELLCRRLFAEEGQMGSPDLSITLQFSPGGDVMTVLWHPVPSVRCHGHGETQAITCQQPPRVCPLCQVGEGVLD